MGQQAVVTPEDRIERLERAVRYLANEIDRGIWRSANVEVDAILDATPRDEEKPDGP